MSKQIVFHNSMDKILNERIEKNHSLFTEEEIKIINYNFKLMKKIYCLGILDDF